MSSSFGQAHDFDGFDLKALCLGKQYSGQLERFGCLRSAESDLDSLLVGTLLAGD